MPIRRVSQIDDGVRLFRSIGNEKAVEVFQYAELPEGAKVRAKADSVCYGDRGYAVETIADDLQTRLGLPWRLTLDISHGSSRERLDSWHGRSVVSISKKSREDYERYKTQIIAEQERGVIAYASVPFVCIVSIRSEEHDYGEGGHDQVLSAMLLANRRQFFIQDKTGLVEEKAPQPQERLTVNGDDYLIQEVRKDVAILRFRLSRDRGKEVNK